MNTKQHIQQELKNISPLLSNLQKQQVYTLPAEYFEVLPQQIMDKIWDTEKDSSQTPPGYFETFAGKLLERIKTEDLTAANDTPHWLSALKHQPTYLVPQHYFDAASQRMVTATIEKYDHLLKATAPATPYEIPANYFEQLPAQLLQQVATAKVVKITTAKRLLQWAAAAVVVGIMAGALYYYTQAPAAHATLMTSIEEGIKMNDKQFEEKLSNLTDEEISQYIQQYGNEADVQQITAALANEDEDDNDGDMPMSDEKLMDEIMNVLDNKTISN
jgi:hypothetical protein